MIGKGNPQRTSFSTRCPACRSDNLEVFFRSPPVPVLCNELFPTRDEARAAPRGEIALARCSDCGLIHNGAFDPSLVHYGSRYENALHFSPWFGDYAETLAGELVERYGLRNKMIIEIGCGDGDFLGRLCRLGGNRGLGFDPAYESSRAAPPPPGVTILPRQFADADAEWKPDLVCCRHVLEHVPDPVPFLEQAGRLAGRRPETVVFFEVPNIVHTLEQLAIWDVIYEHCLYLSPNSLERLFAAAGFAVIATREVYEGQFLTIEARPARAVTAAGGETGSSELNDIDRRRPTGSRPAPARPPNDTDRLGPLTATFSRHHEQKLARWRDVLAEVERDGDTAVLWGAGSKAVTFLNVLEVDERVVPCVIDINPRKQGCHVPGTGQMIVPPSRLADIRPRLVIVMNPVYRAEIEADLRRHEVRSSILIA